MDDGTVTAMAIVLASQRTMKASTMPPVSYTQTTTCVAGRRPSLLCLPLIGTPPHQPTTIIR